MSPRFRVLLLMAALCAVLGAPASARAATEGALDYSVTDRQATVIGCSTSAAGALTIPDTLGGAPVTSIGETAFYGRAGLTSVVIPDGVTVVGAHAFESCTGLATVTIPSSVTSIGVGAFNGCRALEHVDLPSGITEIPMYTFEDCSKLTSITVPPGVTSIGNAAFFMCSSLREASLPASLRAIGEGAFWQCSSLATAPIPAGVVSIGFAAFYGCSSITAVAIPPGLASIENHTFTSCASLTTVTIPASVTSIADEAFVCCSSLRRVVFLGPQPAVGQCCFDLAAPGFTVYFRKSLSSGFATPPGPWYPTVWTTRGAYATAYCDDFGTPLYQVRYDHGPGGVVAGASTQDVSEGDAAKAVTAVADRGYRFVGWSDGSVDALRADADVTADLSVTATFERDPSATCRLSYLAAVGGAIAGTPVQVVPFGGAGLPVTAVPNAGYHFVRWTDGLLTATRTDLNVTTDSTVTASFARDLKPATVYTPVAPVTMRRGRSSTIYGYVAPRHASGTYLVTLQFFLRDSRGVYVYHHSVLARRYVYSATRSKYAALVSLPHAGKWRVRAFHSDSGHSPSYSSWRYITVR